MAVRAKFKVQRIERLQHTRYKPGEESKPQMERELETVELQTIAMAPVYSQDPNAENKRFWEASPSGEIKLGTVSPAAWQEFELGAEYYVDFTRAE
jgi:hypothetical protein